MTEMPEFSRPVAAHTLPRSGREVTIEADAAERAALARRFGLIALDRLRAQFRLRPGAGGTIAVHGTLSAAVVQRCVVTLDPLPAEIEEEVEAVFADAPAGPDADEIEIDPLAAEVEPLVDGRIDLGELAAQHLSLALDPYPRSPDAPPLEDAPEPPAEGMRRPFAVLKGGGQGGKGD